MKLLRITVTAFSILIFAGSNSYADPTIVLGTTRGSVEDSGTTSFNNGIFSGESFIVQEITPATADKTQPLFFDRATNIMGRATN